ncbi:type II asparaginase [Phascolarctobacterium sp.]|uniref:type II asparaginase n=1 Tax=Phascolarctobacterium sp. TaxID=2049039 RepID=UPI00386ACE3A
MEAKSLKHIVILATGGTIAGKAGSALQMTGYQAGAFSVQDLLDSVPGLDAHAKISGEQLCNIGSQDMQDAIILQMAQRCNELLAQNDVDGIVITHGTDTMEESAYFLNLTVKSSKPVVMVGAMRPATAMSADGPLNLLNAVKVAAEDASVGKGVLLVMNDCIYGGRDVTKTNTTNVATFHATNGGALGYITGGKVQYYYAPLRLHTVATEFDVAGVTQLPRVDILYSHANDDGILAEAAVAAGAQGIVYAGSGMGSLHAGCEAALAAAIAKGVAVVRSSRTGSGVVVESKKAWTEMGILDGDNLNPQKARILLQLALCVTKDRDAIREIFGKY